MDECMDVTPSASTKDGLITMQALWRSSRATSSKRVSKAASGSFTRSIGPNVSHSTASVSSSSSWVAFVVTIPGSLA